MYKYINVYFVFKNASILDWFCWKYFMSSPLTPVLI